MKCTPINSINNKIILCPILKYLIIFKIPKRKETIYVHKTGEDKKWMFKNTLLGILLMIDLQLPRDFLQISLISDV